MSHILKRVLPVLNQFKLNNQTVLIRADFNVAIKNGLVSDNSRIKASLETIEYCLKHNAKVLLISHLGRPIAGSRSSENQAHSLKPVADELSKLMGIGINFVEDWQNYDFSKINQKVSLLENIRFESGETDCDDKLSQKIATLADLIIIDAFGTAHRRHASTFGAIHYSKFACAGLLLEKEIKSLSQAIINPKPPILAIVGGAKVSSKLLVLKNLINKVNHIILGGGIINTFLLAKGYPIGQSLVETNLVSESLKILKQAENQSVQIHLPSDVVVCKDFNHPINFETKVLDDVLKDDIIMDVGDVSANQLTNVVMSCQSILWNGPLGVFEYPQFANGTQKLTQAICKQTQNGAFSIAGGGDTIVAINQFKAQDDISYISTGGGAFLEFIAGKELPVVSALINKKQTLSI